MTPRADRCLRCFALNPQNRAGLPLAPPPRPPEAAPRTDVPLGDEAIAGISIASDPPALLPRSGRLDFRFDSAEPSPFRSFEVLPGPAGDEVRGLVRQLGLPLTPPPPPPPPDPDEDPQGAVTEPPDAEADAPAATLSVATAAAPAAPRAATLSVATATLSVASSPPEPDEAGLLRSKLLRARDLEFAPPPRCLTPPPAVAASPRKLAPARAASAVAAGAAPALAASAAAAPALAAPAAAAPARERAGLLLPRASARIYAWAVDAALIVLCAGLHVAVAAALLGRTVLLPEGRQSADTWADALLFARHLPLCWALLCGCLAVAYSWLFAALGGRTPGMQLAGLRLRRVARGDAGTVSASRALARALLALPATALGLFSPVLALCDARGQSLHDKLTGCQVVDER